MSSWGKVAVCRKGLMEAKPTTLRLRAATPVQGYLWGEESTLCPCYGDLRVEVFWEWSSGLYQLLSFWHTNNRALDEKITPISCLLKMLFSQKGIKDLSKSYCPSIFTVGAMQSCVCTPKFTQTLVWLDLEMGPLRKHLRWHELTKVASWYCRTNALTRRGTRQLALSPTCSSSLSTCTEALWAQWGPPPAMRREHSH